MSTDIELPRPMGVAVSQGTVVEQSRAVAEVAAAVQVAKSFPRDTNRATEQMQELCGRLAVASRAFYSVPRRGSGMSIHIARELARIWQNVDYGVRELRRDDEAGESEMQAWAWDQQENVRSTRSFIVPHARIANKQRVALTDLGDIYLNNQNQGAKAVRECIFAMLPGWFKTEAEARLRDTLEKGDGKPIEQRRTDAVDKFKEIGVTEAQIEAYLKRPMSQWGVRDIAELTKAFMSITQDGIPKEEFFVERPVELE
jgi:hypothetical protein